MAPKAADKAPAKKAAPAKSTDAAKKKKKVAKVDGRREAWHRGEPLLSKLGCMGAGTPGGPCAAVHLAPVAAPDPRARLPPPRRSRPTRSTSTRC
jgi:hypothetical protein